MEKKKKKNYCKKANKNHSDPDATLLIATFLFLQLCKCVIVLSGYIVYILYLNRKRHSQSRDYCYSKINTIQKSPSCFTVNAELLLTCLGLHLNRF